MVILTIWWLGFLLELLVLIRSFRNKTFKLYSFFYAYIATVFVTEIALDVLYTIHPIAYGRWFWRIEITTLILGCGIILEIFRHVLSPYPGADRFARISGLLVFAAVFAFALFYPRLTYGRSVAESFEVLERDLRAVQAILLFGIVGVVSYYRIPLGRNIRGMVYGYALYIGTCIANLALRAYGGVPAHQLWNTIQPFSYDVAVAIWVVALWSYNPNPAPEGSLQLGADYEALALRTRHAVSDMRSYIARTARP